MAHRDIVEATKTTRKSRVTEPACRLFGLVARQACKVVIFRRGPSKQCCLVMWDLATDQFEIGQWVKTRVREQWSDVSPDAQYLFYGADDYQRGDQSYTNFYMAVSIPPFFTALAFWPEYFAGRWLSNILLVCDHVPEPDYNHLPAHVAVRVKKPHEANAVSNPLYRIRLLRDGWAQKLRPRIPSNFRGRKKSGYLENFDPPIIVFKRSNAGIVLEDRMHGRGPAGHAGPGEKIEIAILRPDESPAFTFADADWADFDNNGDLLFARNGCLYRLDAGRIAEQTDAMSAIAASRCLIDLAPLRFEQKRAPYADAVAERSVT